MREIKFRAWNLNEKKMEYFGDRFYWFEEAGMSCMEDLKGMYELMQYTGLKDKNGKEIFERDIITDDEGYIDEIIFGDGEFYALCHKSPYPDIHPNPSEQSEGLAHLAICNFWKVIGNIYENPELLKGDIYQNVWWK